MKKSSPRRSVDSSQNAPKEKQTDDKPPQIPTTGAAPNDVVDEASDESFPASDPPSWTETAASKNNAGR